MKWNIEWVDLQNMERMVAECWRMSEHQLERYVQKLSKQKDLIFAGELGIKFLELLQKSTDEGKKLDWPKLQKDIRLMKDLIQDGQAQHDVYWKSQYQELTADTRAYFATEFGRAFTEQLAAKLDLDKSDGQRMLQNDIGKIQKICQTCNWDDEEKARKALLLLTQDEKYYFSSWLGDAFINVLQERYGKKEAEEKSGLRIQPETAQIKPSSFQVKIIWTLLVCISIGMICILLYLQSDGTRGAEKLKELFTGMASEMTSEIASEIMPDKEAEKKTQNVEQYDVQQYDVQQNDTQIADNDTADIKSQDGSQIKGDDQAGQIQKQDADSHALDANTADTGTDSVPETVADPHILPQYESFHQDYPDLFGWLKIPGTSIDHPVMQSDDEQRGEKYYYLHRDYTGKQSEAGSLFVESKSSCFPQDDNTVIYGHNMSNGRNFGVLEKYKDSGFFKEHPVIQYDTIYETGIYQIVAVLITRILYQEEEGFRYYRFYKYQSQQEFQECSDFIQKNRLYDTGQDLEYGDQLVMLSTCEYSRENGRLVVVAKKVG
ncbi:MAG: class B sortase [Eubacterium sp.]|nr:class B sortase [Eubacterium sp.]